MLPVSCNEPQPQREEEHRGIRSTHRLDSSEAPWVEVGHEPHLLLVRTRCMGLQVPICGTPVDRSYTRSVVCQTQLTSYVDDLVARRGNPCGELGLGIVVKCEASLHDETWVNRGVSGEPQYPHLPDDP